MTQKEQLQQLKKKIAEKQSWFVNADVFPSDIYIDLEDTLIALEKHCRNNFVNQYYSRNKFRVYVDKLTNYDDKNKKRWELNKKLNSQSEETKQLLIDILCD